MSVTGEKVMARTVQESSDQRLAAADWIPGGVVPERSGATDTARAHEIRARIPDFDTGAVRT